MKNKHSRVVDQIILDGLPEVIDAMIKEAKSGNAQAAKLLVSLNRPPVRDKPLTIQLPILGSPSDATKVSIAVSNAMFGGKLTPKEADDVLSVIERVAKISQVFEMEERVNRLERTTNIIMSERIEEKAERDRLAKKAGAPDGSWPGL